LAGFVAEHTEEAKDERCNAVSRIGDILGMEIVQSK
jgi:hypothetical protein